MRRVIGIGLTGLLSIATVACGSNTAPADTETRAPTGATTSPSSPLGAPGSARPTASEGSAVFPTGCGDGLPNLSGPLTGSWRGSDGGIYYLRQAGDCLWWLGTTFTEFDEAGGKPFGWANVAVGRIVEDKIYIEWGDVLGDSPGRGTLTLQLSDGGDHIDTVARSNEWFGGSFWDRVRPEPTAAQP